MTFTFLGNIWIDKPPLYFWLMKASSHLFGENEFSLRLPGALLTIFSLFFIYKISTFITKDKTIALFSAFILLSSSLFIFAGRQLRLDVPVTFFILLSYYVFLKTRQKPFWFLIFGLSLSGAILTKSVVGLIIFPIIGIHLFIFRDFNWLKNIYFWSGLFLAAIIVIPWHIYQYVLYGDNFWKLYFFNVGNRLSGQIVLGQNPTILDHLWQFSLATFPWSFVFLLLLLLVILFRILKLKIIWNLEFENWNFIKTNLLIFLFLFSLFLIPQNRLLYYFIPSLPFMAMFIGNTLKQLHDKKPHIFYALLLPLLFLGLANTAFKIFFPAHLLNRYEIAEEEKQVGLITAQKPEAALYIYRWQFYPALLYYSRKDDLYKISDFDSLPRKGFLLIPRPLKNNLESQLTPKLLYSGQFAVLYELK